MSTRITTSMMPAQRPGRPQRASRSGSTQTQRKMSSGKEITQPSDDPFGAARALTLRADLEGIQQYQRNVDDAQGWQDVTDAALVEITDVAPARPRARRPGRDRLAPTRPRARRSPTRSTS